MSATNIIKEFLANNDKFGDKAADWKRLSKKKKQGTQSTISRIFNNKATGQEVEVLEITSPADALQVQKHDGQITSGNSLFVFKETKPKASITSFETNLETDPEKIKAAKEAVQILINNKYYKEETKFEELYQKAGFTAFANQFCFAYVVEDGDEGMWYVTPIDDYKNSGYLFDGHVPYKAGFLFEAMENVFECEYDWTPEKTASELMKLGYIFDKDFQSWADPTYVNLVQNKKGSTPKKPSM